MKIVYLAGPYRGANPAETERNIRTAQRYAMALTEAGIAVYSPHLNTAHFDGLQPDEWFFKHGLEMLRRCDALVVMPGFENSSGTLREVMEAQKLQIPTCYVPDPETMIDMNYVDLIRNLADLPPRSVEVG